CHIAVEKYRRMQAAKAAESQPVPPPPPPGPAEPPAQTELPPSAGPLPPPVHHALVTDEEDREPINFREHLPRVFHYPFSGVGPWVMGATISFLIVASFIPFAGFFLTIVGYGYFCAYCFRVVTTTADSPDDPAPWPGMENPGSGLILPIIKIAWAGIASYLPAGLYLFFISPIGPMDPVFWLLMLAGAVYAPMGLLAVVMSGNFLALNPFVVVPAILRTFKDYIFCLIAMVVVMVMRGLFESILKVPIPILGSAIQWFITLYFLTVEMRILGLLYAANEEELGWYT
ncbi:MAG: hypothetical protein AB1896_20870, partial [Thermodesulfobacteriota bacterium]